MLMREYLCQYYITRNQVIITKAKRQARPKTNKQQTSKTRIAHPPKKASEMTQDDAAIVIQKQYRGYQARKEYGPLLNSEKITSEVVLFMKQYCRKWKAKSVFQVLLMYRAAKHQDTVYMSQQVHLYNQNAVSALRMINKERVSLHNIISDTTPLQFLGKFRPKQWKLPFRLNDMPFCDSSYLCGTTGKRLWEYAFRTITKDDAPWDDPYEKRSRFICATGQSTDMKDIGLPVEEGGDVFSFIQTPYTRDPNYVDMVYSGQPYRKGDHYFTSKSGKERRKLKKAPPAPHFCYSNNNIQANRSQFNSSNNFAKSSSSNYSNNKNSGISNRPVSTYYQPPRPATNFVTQQYNESDNRNFNFRDKLKPVSGNQKQNPIRELEMKFKQINSYNSDNEEESPTFNFQAMLRKTNHNRASIRRSPEVEMASSYGQGPFPMIPELKSVNQTKNFVNNYNNNNNNVVYNSSAIRNKSGALRPLLRQDSGDCRKMMSHHYKESVKKARADEVTTEIAPGIIIQGHVAEL